MPSACLYDTLETSFFPLGCLFDRFFRRSSVTPHTDLGIVHQSGILCLGIVAGLPRLFWTLSSSLFYQTSFSFYPVLRIGSSALTLARLIYFSSADPCRWLCLRMLFPVPPIFLSLFVRVFLLFVHTLVRTGWTLMTPALRSLQRTRQKANRCPNPSSVRHSEPLAYSSGWNGIFPAPPATEGGRRWTVCA